MAKQQRKIEPEYVDMLRAMVMVINKKLKKVHPHLARRFEFDRYFVYDNQKQEVVPAHPFYVGFRVLDFPDRMCDMDEADNFELQVIRLAAYKWKDCMEYVEHLQTTTKSYYELKNTLIRKTNHYE